MRKIIFRSFFALTLSVTMISCSSSDDESLDGLPNKEISVTELPSAATAYLGDTFKGFEILKIESIAENENGVTFLTYLSEDVIIGFDSAGDVVSMDASPEVLKKVGIGTEPLAISRYLAAVYRNASIKKINYLKGYKIYTVTLSNKIVVRFAEHPELGEWVWAQHIGSNRIERHIPFAVIAAEYELIAAYIQNNFPALTINRTERNGEVVKVYFNSRKKLELTFSQENQALIDTVDKNNGRY